MPSLLAIDTSHTLCSVALHHAGRLIQQQSTETRQHTRQLLPMIEAVLKESDCSFTDLEAIAFVNGPGSFTGLRIGAGVAQGLAFARSLPVIGISSLAVMAYRAAPSVSGASMMVCVTARENEVYCGGYRVVADRLVCEREDAVGTPAAVLAHWPASGDRRALVGNGEGQLYAQINHEQRHTIAYRLGDCVSDAASLCALALQRFARKDWVSAAQAQPVYLKDQMDYQE